MRTKDEILKATRVNAKKASSPKDISLIHELHSLEVFIDIRNILEHRLLEIDRDLDKILDAIKTVKVENTKSTRLKFRRK